MLRKDFMIDEYQFVEAKSIGADVVLLIASILSPSSNGFYRFGKEFRHGSIIGIARWMN